MVHPASFHTKRHTAGLRGSRGSCPTAPGSLWQKGAFLKTVAM